jgi:hypothetical protein
MTPRKKYFYGMRLNVADCRLSELMKFLVTIRENGFHHWSKRWRRVGGRLDGSGRLSLSTFPPRPSELGI